jgi:hypothetical protein
VIEIDDDDPDGVILIGDKAQVEKNKQTAVCPMDCSKHAKVNSLISYSYIICFYTMQAQTNSFV